VPGKLTFGRLLRRENTASHGPDHCTGTTWNDFKKAMKEPSASVAVRADGSCHPEA
jgi:hypothetical protein